MRRRDYQKARLYRWERRQPWFGFGERLTLDECQRLVDRAVAAFSVPPIHVGAQTVEPAVLRCVRVMPGRGRQTAACANGLHIRLPRGMRTAAIVAHEVAHSINERWAWRTRAHDDWHGPRFCGWYLLTAGLLCGADYTTTWHSMVAAGLDVTQAPLAGDRGLPAFSRALPDRRPGEACAVSGCEAAMRSTKTGALLGGRGKCYAHWKAELNAEKRARWARARDVERGLDA